MRSRKKPPAYARLKAERDEAVRTASHLRERVDELACHVRWLLSLDRKASELLEMRWSRYKAMLQAAEGGS